MKFWAHRVNSLERLRLLSGKFPGVETDVVYTAQNGWEVGHPPIKPDDRLDLSIFLKAFATRPDTKCWLDCRGIDSNNVAGAIEHLDTLATGLSIKNRLIVEMYEPYTANKFCKAGYVVSLHVSAKRLSQEGFANALNNELLPGVAYLSQSAEYVPDLKKTFPGRKVLTWDLAFWNYISTDSLVSLAEENQVDVILVNIRSRNWR